MTVKTHGLDSTAWHESGHAVVQLHFGLPFQQVTTVPSPSGDILGSVTSYLPIATDFGIDERPGDRKKAAKALIIMCYAGLEAERLFDPEASEEGASQDHEDAFELSREHGIHPRSGYVGDDRHLHSLLRRRHEARRLVRLLRHPISVLAAALLNRPTLTQNEVETVLEHCLEIGAGWR